MQESTPQTTGEVTRSEITPLYDNFLDASRGLKVVAETMWSNDEGRYVPCTDRVQTVECSSRTAVEDVSHVAAITEYFEG